MAGPVVAVRSIAVGHNLRVIRGGSWNSEPVFLRSSDRIRNLPGTRNDLIGLRLAQDLP